MKYRYLYLVFLSQFVFNYSYGIESLKEDIQEWSIEDDKLKLSVDERGRIIHLENKTSSYGNVISSADSGIFNLVAKIGENWEATMRPEDQDYQILKKENTIQIRVNQVRFKKSTADLSIDLTIKLLDGTLQFLAEIQNNQEGLLVTDFTYPRIGVIKMLKDLGRPDLLWPQQTGELYTNIGDRLSSMSDTRYSPNSITITYPGNASMQWMSLIDGDQCLYFSGRDRDFYASSLKVNGSKENKGAITLAINRFSFVKSGEKWTSPTSIMSLYTGSWRKGAKEYKDWTSTWLKDVDPPQWVKDMTGYFLVINRQQYGDEMWDYDELPKLYELAKEYGCDVLGLFGWYKSGHDNLYPDLEVSETMGGKNTLISNIEKVQNQGGQVTLYFQGHLMDMNSDYYKNKGHLLESKSIWGVPYYEKYNKYNESDFMKYFTSKTFSTVCPSAVEWHELMVEKAKWVSSFQPDGILYDQLGGMIPNPCFDESHNHYQNKPSLSYSRGRLQMLNKIQTATKKIKPNYAFFTEHITDIYSQYADCLHGIKTSPDPNVGNRLKIGDNSLTTKVNYPEMFKYCFPNKIITIRNAFPYITPRYANYAITFGMRYEMELRFQKDRELILNNSNQEWKKYAFDLNKLKQKYWDFLGTGKFIDEEYFVNHNTKVISKGYVNDNQLAIVLWNDSDEIGKIEVEVPGYEWIEYSTVKQTSNTKLEYIDSQEVVVLLYQKK